MTILDEGSRDGKSAWSRIDDLIREHGRDIVDACADSFECTMEDYGDNTGREESVPKQPVLVRQSILDVKNQIK